MLRWLKSKFSSVAGRIEQRRYSAPNLKRYTFKSRKVIWPPNPKSILIALNRSADAVLTAVDQERFRIDNQCSLFDVKNISELEWSVLLLEDRRFLIHSGVDWVHALFRVLRQILTVKRVGGVSTIEQQLGKYPPLSGYGLGDQTLTVLRIVWKVLGPGRSLAVSTTVRTSASPSAAHMAR